MRHVLRGLSTSKLRPTNKHRETELAAFFFSVTGNFGSNRARLDGEEVSAFDTVYIHSVRLLSIICAIELSHTLLAKKIISMISSMPQLKFIVYLLLL